MDETPTDLAVLYGPYHDLYMWFVLISLLSLLATIVLSFKEGGIREVGENLLLWFLLFGAFNLFIAYPVSDEDELAGAVLFIAFGVCRAVKHFVSLNVRFCPKE